jgi:GntR family transcriptional regulator
MTFTQEMRRAGRIPSSRVLERVVQPASSTEAASLGLPSRQAVVHLRRLRLADGEPIALESTVLIGACAAAVMGADLANGSLHETLGRAGFVLVRGTGTISAAAATADDARLLAIAPGDPLLVERRVIVDDQGRPIEATESRYVADRYGLVVQFDVEAPDLEAAPTIHA